MVSERLWINQESIHLFVLFYNNQTTSPKLAPTILLHNGWWIWEQCKTHMWRAIINFTIVGGKWKCYLYVHICIFHDVAHKRSASSAYERNVSENNQDPRAAFLPITMLQNSSKITNLYLENTYIYTHTYRSARMLCYWLPSQQCTFPLKSIGNHYQEMQPTYRVWYPS